MSWEEIKLEISAEVKQRLEERHILEDEVKQVIYHAETTGEKLQESETNKYLSQLRIASATFYVEYSVEQDRYLIRSAYAHKSEIIG